MTEDVRSGAGKVLGVDVESAKKEAAGWGQTEFDKPWLDLSPEERVLLYSYFFQLGHLEELTEAFRQLFAGGFPEEAPVVVDLGCGPFTGGLAFAGVVGGNMGFDYIGLDRSCEMCRFGEQLACAAEPLGGTASVDRHWASDLSSFSWGRPTSWRPVFVIVSYLLASPTLDATSLVQDLQVLLEQIGRGPVTVLYTNSIRQDANRSFESFCVALQRVGFQLTADDTGVIEIDRRAGPSSRKLRYALFHRQERNILRLEGQ